MNNLPLPLLAMMVKLAFFFVTKDLDSMIFGGCKETKI